ncbi:hypothetical protein Taro_005867 [Colocasia esculenta]|uniref:Aminotransferase-like plant mobile domain-containing protein n=1 Tax=Colocasia esculenta TaxID=4460 RepID=A0A843TUB6_COLES|nr:hypothetical protein [Colocasia esculenta]
MEGDGGGQGGKGGGRRRKKSIRRRQPGEETSTAAPEAPPVVPMEEDPAPAMGDEDEPVGPKKVGLRTLNFECGMWGGAEHPFVGRFARGNGRKMEEICLGSALVMRQTPCRITRAKAMPPCRLTEGDKVPIAMRVPENDGGSVALRRRQTPCRLIRTKSDLRSFLPTSDLLVFALQSELQSQLGWAVIRAIYDGLPDFQVCRLEGMGFGPFLRLEELAPDVALIRALKERWYPECHAFLFSWGHMVPTLEDVAVTGTTYTSYQEPVKRLLGLEVRGERSSLVQRTALQASLGVVSARRQTGEGQAEHMERMTDDARAAMAEEEGEAADRDLRRFLTLVIRKMVLGTRGDPVGCRFLPLLEDLSSVGNYAWGAALLAHLFDSLGTSRRETGIAGFFPLLQVWAYYHLPSLGRGVARRRGAVPLLQCWRFYRDKRSLRRQVTLIHDALETVPFRHVQWTPYVREDDATQPWVERGRPYFGRDIWVHCFNTVVPLHHRLVAWTLGLHQAVVEFPTRQRSWERPGRSFRGIQQVTDWTVQVQEQLDDWERRGKEVVSEAASDEDYFRAYARKYGAQLEPEGQISSLERILHSTIQQRDDLQTVVDQLQAELDRAQQMVGGASSSREDPGRSILEGQLALAAARAEDALS